MKKSLERDLTDLTLILESFHEHLNGLTQADMIDVAARLKPVAKACAKFDETVKDIIKVKLDETEGELPGHLFKAVLKLVPTSRLNQKRFKEEKPTMFATFVDEVEDIRITFEVR